MRWCTQPYWMAPFHMALNDPFLHIMFTEKATQHAGANSYAVYFQKQILAGLLREDGNRNPFLQHIFLGDFLRRDAPTYMYCKRDLPIQFFHGTLLEVPDIYSYDVVSLSNILDWSDEKEIIQWAQRLQRLLSGAMVLIRQLNHDRDWYPLFASHFTDVKDFDGIWQERDRSLFYNHFRLFVRK